MGGTALTTPIANHVIIAPGIMHANNGRSDGGISNPSPANIQYATVSGAVTRLVNEWADIVTWHQMLTPNATSALTGEDAIWDLAE